MRRFVRILLILAFTPPLVAAGMGWLAGPSFLHPARRELSPDLIKEADSAFSQIGTHREDFDVRAADGVLLRGWKVRSAKPNGKWVLVFHGVADNRAGVVGQAQLLIQAGYSVVMMDARAHGASDGPMATYGWWERRCWRLARGRCSIMASLRQVFRLVRFHRRKRWLPVHFRCC